MAYATRDQLFLLALAAPAFVTYARPFDDADPSTATIRLLGHGLSTNDRISFVCTPGGSLPTGVSGFQLYAPVPVSGDLFQISGFDEFLNPGNGWMIQVDQMRRLDMHLEERAAFIDEHLTAHEPPILRDDAGNYPMVLIGMNARLAAREAIRSLESENPQFREPIDRLMKSEEKDFEILKAWKDGKPIQPRPKDETSTPENVIRAGSGRRFVQWTTGRF